MKLPSSSLESMSGFPGGFTVLMAVYGGDEPGMFERAIRSVYMNTLLPNEFILVVDGPVPKALDDTLSIMLNTYPIEVFRLPSNVGLARSLNFGLKRVRTRWVLRADADDYNLSTRFATQANAVNSSNGCVDLMGAAIQEVDKNGRMLAIRSTVEGHADILKYAAYRNPFNHMTVAFKTEFALSCGGYPEIHLKEDYALWASFIFNGAKTLNLPDILVFATTGEEMYRRRGGLRYALAEISLQRHLVKMRIKSPSLALLQGLARAFVFLLPSTLRGWIYRNILRSSL